MTGRSRTFRRARLRADRRWQSRLALAGATTAAAASARFSFFFEGAEAALAGLAFGLAGLTLLAAALISDFAAWRTSRRPPGADAAAAGMPHPAKDRRAADSDGCTGPSDPGICFDAGGSAAPAPEETALRETMPEDTAPSEATPNNAPQKEETSDNAPRRDAARQTGQRRTERKWITDCDQDLFPRFTIYDDTVYADHAEGDGVSQNASKGHAGDGPKPPSDNAPNGLAEDRPERLAEEEPEPRTEDGPQRRCEHDPNDHAQDAPERRCEDGRKNPTEVGPEGHAEDDPDRQTGQRRAERKWITDCDQDLFPRFTIYDDTIYADHAESDGAAQDSSKGRAGDGLRRPSDNGPKDHAEDRPVRHAEEEPERRIEDGPERDSEDDPKDRADDGPQRRAEHGPERHSDVDPRRSGGAALHPRSSTAKSNRRGAAATRAAAAAIAAIATLAIAGAAKPLLAHGGAAAIAGLALGMAAATLLLAALRSDGAEGRISGKPLDTLAAYAKARWLDRGRSAVAGSGAAWKRGDPPNSRPRRRAGPAKSQN